MVEVPTIALQKEAQRQMVRVGGSLVTGLEPPLVDDNGNYREADAPQEFEKGVVKTLAKFLITQPPERTPPIHYVSAVEYHGLIGVVRKELLFQSLQPTVCLHVIGSPEPTTQEAEVTVLCAVEFTKDVVAGLIHVKMVLLPRCDDTHALQP